MSGPDKKYKSAGLAVLLAVIVNGLGHIYLGEYAIGVALLIAVPAGIYAATALIGPLAIPLGIVVAGITVYDAYRRAVAHNANLDRELRERNIQREKQRQAGASSTRLGRDGSSALASFDHSMGGGVTPAQAKPEPKRSSALAGFAQQEEEAGGDRDGVSGKDGTDTRSEHSQRVPPKPDVAAHEHNHQRSEQPGPGAASAAGGPDPKPSEQGRNRESSNRWVMAAIVVAVLGLVYAGMSYNYETSVQQGMQSMLHEHGFSKLQVKHVFYGWLAPIESQSAVTLLVQTHGKTSTVTGQVTGNPTYSSQVYVQISGPQMLRLNLGLN